MFNMRVLGARGLASLTEEHVRAAQPAWARLVHGLFSWAVISLSTPATGQALPPEKEDWNVIRTRHFEVFSNASLKLATRLALDLEQFQVLLDRFSTPPADSSFAPTTIIVFKDQAAFRPYRLKRSGGSEEYVGKFLSHPDGNFIVMAVDQDPLAVIFHEFVHYHLSRRYANVPLWLNEGLAEFYSTTHVKDEHLVVGSPVQHHLEFLNAYDLFSIWQLFATNTTSHNYNESERRGVFYAQSWVTVHYLLRGTPAESPRLWAWLDNVERGVDVVQATRQVYEMTPDELHENVVAYRFRKVFDFGHLPERVLAVDRRVETSRMPREDVVYHLGNYLAHDAPWQAAEAEAHFVEAIRLAPRHARSHAGIGLLRSSAGRIDEARQYYDTAIDLDPHDYLARILKARSLMDEFQTSLAANREHAALPQNIAEARALFTRAIAVRPDFMEAHVGLGNTYLYDPGDRQPGIEAYRTALGAWPSRRDVAYNLMVLHLKNHDATSAHNVFEIYLARGNDPKQVAAAKEALLQSEIDLANQAFAKNDIETGIAILERVKESSQDEGRKRELQAHIEDAQRLLEHNRYVDLYNDAVEEANAGRYAAARELLARVATGAQDSVLLGKTRDFLEELTRRTK